MCKRFILRVLDPLRRRSPKDFIHVVSVEGAALDELKPAFRGLVLTLLSRDLFGQVYFVSDHDFERIGSALLFDGVNPLIHLLKGAAIAHVVDTKDNVGVLVVIMRQTLELFGSRCIINNEFDVLIVDDYDL